MRSTTSSKRSPKACPVGGDNLQANQGNGHGPERQAGSGQNTQGHDAGEKARTGPAL